VPTGAWPRHSRQRELQAGGANSNRFADWADGRPETELNFKFYRQPTNRIVGISDDTAAILEQFFQ